MPERGDPEAVIEALADGADPGLVSAGARHFGFVIGGSLPAALGADWLVSTARWRSSPMPMLTGRP